MINKIPAITLIVILFILFSNNVFAGILEQTLDESALETLLNRGELIYLEEENGDLKYITLVIIIDAPLDKAWDVLTDFEKYPDFVPGHKGCKIIKRFNNEITVESAVEFKFMGIGSTIKYTTLYLLQKPELVIIDTKKIKETGRYKLIPIDNGKRVVLFRTKEVDKDIFTGAAKILINKKPELEFSMQLSPLKIAMNAIKVRTELFLNKKG